MSKDDDYDYLFKVVEIKKIVYSQGLDFFFMSNLSKEKVQRAQKHVPADEVAMATNLYSKVNIFNLSSIRFLNSWSRLC